MKNLSNLLTGILAGYTSFYGITANANTGDDMISPQDMVSDPSFGQIPIDATVTAPDYILRLPDREASGLFASHRSHRSHSSHRSHYSSRTGGTTTTPTKKYTPAPAAPVLTDTTLGVRVLKKGMSGPDVFELESLLKRNGYKLIKPDRYFDETLEVIVKDFQSKAGIPADGTVGPLTILYLKQ